jgi:predicted signal transduction protein with EAL and GGDEF domain
LIEVTQRLVECIRADDTVARLGGDEFVVMLEDIGEESEQAASHAKAVGEKILEALSLPYLLDDHEYFGTCSIGVCLFRGDALPADELLKRADTAMYQAKQHGRNALRFFDPAMQAALESRIQLESSLRHALPRQQFRLYYQAQVNEERQIIGAEVLLRWQHPESGMISPATFIPVAEESGLIVPIGLWVLQTACSQLKSWEQDPCTRDLQLAVNVSACQFHQGDFVERVCQILLASGANPALLKLELTESVVVDNVTDMIDKMRMLKEIGISFSMDDFGTGHSSLAYLKRLPLCQLKIDQSFVRDITTDPNDAAIVQTIIAITRTLGLNVIAEGVETEAQLEFLKRHGCLSYQGYLFGKPVTVEEFERLVSAMLLDPPPHKIPNPHE